MYIPDILEVYTGLFVSRVPEILISPCLRHFPTEESVGMRGPNPSGNIIVAVNKAFYRDLRGVLEVSIYTVAPHTGLQIIVIVIAL